MNNSIKAALAVAVVLTLSVCLVSASDFTSDVDATDIDQTFINNLIEDASDIIVLPAGDYVLKGAVNIDAPIHIEGNVSIDLAGQTISYTGGEALFVLTGSDSLILSNSSGSGDLHNYPISASGESTLTFSKLISNIVVNATESSKIYANANVSLGGSLMDQAELIIGSTAADGVILKGGFIKESTATITNNGVLKVFLKQGSESITIKNNSIFLEFTETGETEASLTDVDTASDYSNSNFAIPSRIDSHNVTTIGAGAFKDCTGLRQINLNFSNIINIGANAFENCTDLKSLSSTKVTSVGDAAFKGCTSLTSVTFKNVTSIKSETFSGCDSLSDLTLGSNCTIPDGTFIGLMQLKSVTLGDVQYTVDPETGSLASVDPDDANFSTGSRYFMTLSQALTSAANGDTIHLLKDVVETDPVTVERSRITLDLGGNTLKLVGSTTIPGISVTGSGFTITNGAIDDTRDSGRSGDCITIRVSNSDVATLTDVNVKFLDAGDATGKNNVGIVVAGASTLILNGDTSITSTTSTDATCGSIGVVVYGIGDMNNTTNLIMEDNASIDVNQYGISGDGTVRADGATSGNDFRGTTITITDNASVTANGGWGIYHPQAGTLTVEGEATVKGLTGIEMRSGTLNVLGGTIETLDNAKFDADGTRGSGPTTTGVGIAVVQHSSEMDISVEISGGTVSGHYALYQSNLLKNDDDAVSRIDLSVYGGELKTTGTDQGTDQPASIYSENKTDFVFGGTFSDGLDSNYIKSDYVFDNVTHEIVVDEGKSVAHVGDTGYATLQDAITAAPNGATVVLEKPVKENIVIPSGKELTLDLGGNTLTDDGDHTVTVQSGAALAVRNGTIDNVTHQKAAVHNYGTFTMESGLLTRSMESSKSPSDSGNNSFYVVFNHGTFDMRGGTITQNGHYSSLVCNRAEDGSSPVFNMSGGTLRQDGFIALKVEETSTANISGGQIVSGDQAVQNWGVTNISGGTLTGRVSSMSFVDGGTSFSATTNISGGTINGDIRSWKYTYKGVPASDVPDINVTGGTIIGSFESIIRGDKDEPQDVPFSESDITVSGGTFSRPVPDDCLADGFVLSTDRNGNYVVMDEDDILVIPPVDDDDEYVPPSFVIDQSSGSSSDSTTIVACAAAAVVAALMAAFLIMEYRRK